MSIHVELVYVCASKLSEYECILYCLAKVYSVRSDVIPFARNKCELTKYHFYKQSKIKLNK